MRTALIPCLRYDDAPAAILFLCDAFGFLPRAIHADEEDQEHIHHAQLVLGDAMVMLSSADEDGDEDGPTERYRWRTPAEAGGITACTYAVIDDPDAHCARAREHGAEIVDEPHDNDGYPGRGYSARDPEGNLWTFGSYDPFAPPPADG